MNVIAITRALEGPTKKAYFWSILLNAPFWVMYGYLPFILVQELGASPLQVTLLISLKPAVSLLSVYWGSTIRNRPGRLVKNVISSTVAAHLPILLFPFIDNCWYFIAAYALYIMCERGGKPAWMEILKINMESKDRQNLFSKVSSYSYCIGILAPCLFGLPMDLIQGSWRWIFVATSLLSMLSIFWQIKIPIHQTGKGYEPHHDTAWLTKPWRESWNLLKQRKDFRLFQWGFFFGGAGTMLMQPAIPPFFMNELSLSYTELAFALSLCKAVGFAATSPLWARWMGYMDIFKLVGLVTLVMAFFPLFILGGKVWLFSIYFAYILYGVMQAGSELSWHLSGPHFSHQKDSTPFTAVNILMIGLRGLIFPMIGTVLLSTFSAVMPLILGGVFCLLGTYSMMRKKMDKVALEAAA